LQDFARRYTADISNVQYFLKPEICKCQGTWSHKLLLVEICRSSEMCVQAVEPWSSLCIGYFPKHQWSHKDLKGITPVKAAFIFIETCICSRCWFYIRTYNP